VLVQRLTQSLDGKLSVRSGADGTEIAIKLPARPPKP
jgi:signal transduction histidine kinase